MATFPQLLSGAATQYPLTRRHGTRTIRTEAADGTVERLYDPSASTIRWELRLAGLTGPEWLAIETLFRQMEGRHGSFTFLDPAANLLARSEEFAASPWQAGAMVQIFTGVTDPYGGSRASAATNAGQAPQSITQALNAPGDFHYCFSVYARSSQGASLTLDRNTISASASQAYAPTPAWQRFVLAGTLPAAETPVTFGITLPPGASVELFGAQVEAQPGPGAYKRTFDRSGVYPKARFDDDRLEAVLEGPGQYAAVIRLFSAIEG